MIAVIVGVLVGLCLPLQTNANSRLRLSVGSPFLASFLSFLIGTAILFGATLLIDGHLTGLTHAAGLPVWLWTGGLLGVVVLTTNIFLFPRLGSVQTVVLPVTGQVLMGLLIDHFGWFHTARVELTAIRALGAALLVFGVLGAIGFADTLVNRATAIPNGSGRGGSVWLWRIAGIAAGAFSASQTAINGQLGTVLGSALSAAFVSFTVGTIVLLVLVLVIRAPWRLRRIGELPNPWWMWLGGLLGAAFVFGNAALAPIIGTGLTVMAVVLGMMLGSLVIDHFGLLGAGRRPVTVLQVIGLLVMMAAVAVIRLFY